MFGPFPSVSNGLAFSGLGDGPFFRFSERSRSRGRTNLAARVHAKPTRASTRRPKSSCSKTTHQPILSRPVLLCNDVRVPGPTTRRRTVFTVRPFSTRRPHVFRSRPNGRRRHRTWANRYSGSAALPGRSVRTNIAYAATCIFF